MEDEVGPIVLEVTACLPRPIESHLNSFCDVEVTGCKRAGTYQNRLKIESLAEAAANPDAKGPLP